MDSPLSSDEHEVADVLRNLSRLFTIKPEPKPLQRFFGIIPRWGRRKPRSIPSNNPPDPSKALESNQPILPALPAASSPSTPMSFPATSEEAEPNLVSPKKPSPSRSYKIHQQWIEEQNEKIAVLSAIEVNIQQKLEASRGNHISIEAQSSWLNEISLQLKQATRKRRRVEIEEAVNPMNGSDLASVDQHHQINGCDDANTNDHRKRVMVCLPDLNISAEEVDRWERAAEAAQARKRRLEICRQKSSSSAAAAIAAGGGLPPRPRTKFKVRC
ncbi:ArsR-like helix-turn-helix domain-containing protein [Dioscorea alata]|uniref:ArsR-like helix-turn-helix domain-containing protein n=1 Tax=Dioscorea alata TaxID=55571 RepID=A0ACB7WVR6_DIOAL|nr:ArsR-like helix-turn-helix domain-containing protein [Dioscorea alata]